MVERATLSPVTLLHGTAESHLCGAAAAAEALKSKPEARPQAV